ncbi:MAG TPA: hypothetical protein VFN35_20925 [Ktedonobacteraceae bacterium]|nr:hypothetical protein [Ktedonobacteraceae bacterium]
MTDDQEYPMMYKMAERVGQEYVWRGSILDRAAMRQKVYEFSCNTMASLLWNRKSMLLLEGLEQSLAQARETLRHKYIVAGLANLDQLFISLNDAQKAEPYIEEGKV